MENLAQYVPWIISALALLISYLTFRDRKRAEHESAIDDLCIKHNLLRGDYRVLEERINNEIKSLDKLENKIDDISKELK